MFDEHSVWGSVIYRCDYNSDGDWAKLLSIVRWNIKDGLKGWRGGNDLDLLPYMTITTEDRKTFEGASTDQVHDMFTAWAGSEELSDDAEINLPHLSARCWGELYGQSTFTWEVFQERPAKSVKSRGIVTPGLGKALALEQEK